MCLTRLPPFMRPLDTSCTATHSRLGLAVIPSQTLQSIQEHVYDIVSSDTLPTIDITRSVRSVVLSERANKRWSAFMRQTRVLLLLLHVLSAAVSIIMYSTSWWPTRSTVLLNLMFAVYEGIVQILLMRVDILQLLVVTYEFWFMTVVNLASTVLLSVYMPDIRLVNAWAMCIGHEVQTVIDATIASQREFVFGTIVSATATGMLLIFVVLGVMDGVNNQALFSVNGHTLAVTDLLVNGLSTQLLMLMRNAYRRRAAIKEHGNKSTVVQCLTYRCPVRLRVRRRTDSTDFSTATPSETDKLPRLTASFIASAKMVPMQCRPVGLKTSTEKLVFSGIARSILHSSSPIRLHVWRVWALVLRVTGILLTIVSFIPATPLVWRVSGLVVTSVFCFGCGAMYHRQLLRYLVFSFDFVFLSLQFTLIHLCLCDLLSWDTRVVSVVSSWIWIHWALTFDCMPPSVKAKWGLRHSFVLWIAVFCVLAHIVVGVQVAFGHRDTLRDRAVLSIEVFGQRMALNVLSTMLSRMLVTFFWSCRMVWRLWHRKENELLFIHGTVTYVNNRRKLKRDEEELKRFKSLGGRRKASLRQLMTRVGPVVFCVSRVAAEPRTRSLLPSTATDRPNDELHSQPAMTMGTDI